MINKLLRYKVIIVIGLLLVIFLPGVLVGDLDSKTDAIIVSVGIDKAEEKYEVTLQYLLPTQSGQFNKKLDVLSSKSGEISSAISDLSLKLGKNIGLSHCRSIVISDEIAKEDTVKTYDYFSRFKLNTNHISLIYTPKSAKEFLKTSTDSQNALLIDIGDSVDLSSVKLRGMQTFLNDFYIGYFSPSGCSHMGYIDVKEDEEKQESSGGGQGGGGQESGGGEGDEKSGGTKKISNEGKAVVFKKGKKVMVLEKEDVEAFGWFLKDITNETITIKNVLGDQYKNAAVGVQIIDNKAKAKVYFKEGSPVYDLKIRVTVRVSEVEQDDYGLENFDLLKENVNKVLNAAVIRKIEEDFNRAIALSLQHNVDIIDAYNNFYKYRTHQFKKFIDRLPNPDEYMQHITFKVNVDVRGGI